MRLPINHPDFVGQGLSVETGSLVRGPRLLRDGVPLSGVRGRYKVQTNRGAEAELLLRNPLFFDPVPRLRYGSETIHLARPLAWYEYLWIGLPLLLIFIGGFFGAISGMIATYFSARLLRSSQPAIVRYALSGGVSLVAVVVFLVLAIAFRSALGS